MGRGISFNPCPVLQLGTGERGILQEAISMALEIRAKMERFLYSGSKRKRIQSLTT